MYGAEVQCFLSKRRDILGWEFIKENKKVRKQENTLLTDQECDQEKRTKERKQESNHEKKRKKFLQSLLSLLTLCTLPSVNYQNLIPFLVSRSYGGGEETTKGDL